MNRPIRIALAAATAVALSACFLPDRYKAELALKADGTFTADFNGEATMIPYLADYQKWSPERKKAEEAKAPAEFAKMVGKDGIKKAEYLGAGRIAFVVSENGEVARKVDNSFGGAYNLPLGLMKMRSDPLGQLVVESEKIGERDIAAIKQLGAMSKGDICIKSGARVIEHNADSTPGIFSSCYSWKGFDVLTGKQLRMVIDLPAMAGPKS